MELLAAPADRQHSTSKPFFRSTPDIASLVSASSSTSKSRTATAAAIIMGEKRSTGLCRWEGFSRREIDCQPVAAGVVGEAMVAFVLADAYRRKFGGDHIDDVRQALRAYRERIGWPES